jgi:arylsulfate sulfotransferase
MMLLKNVRKLRAIPSLNSYRQLLVFSVVLLCVSTASRDVSATIQVVSSPVLAAAPDSPLAGTLSFSTDVPTRASFKVEGNNEAWWVDSSEFNTNHTIPVLGLAPDSNYSISNIRLSTPGGVMQSTLSDVVPISTPTLPVDVPGFHVLSSTPAQMEPGLTMFGIGSFSTVAVDAQGVVRWYVDGLFPDIRQTEDGLFIGRRAGGAREIDVLGNVTRSWYPTSQGSPPLPGSLPVTSTSDFHHDLFPMKNGNFLTLTKDQKLVTNAPTSYTDPNVTSRTITTDVVIEFDPNGTVVHSWNLADMLDTSRIGYNGLVDWSHSNAVYLDEEDVNDPLDDTIVVSMRHQDAVVKFSRETGQIKWILGNHDNWSPAFQQYLLTPVGDPNQFEWQYHQHAPMELPDGSILLMDNGNRRASPFTGEPSMLAEDSYSRGVIYNIDDDNMTVEQVWEYGSPETADERIYSTTRGDADWMSQTDNRLITFTQVVRIDGVVQSDQHTRIVEVNEAEDVVFDLEIGDPGSNAYAYRSERIPSLYPSGYTVRAVPSPSSGLLLAVAMLTLGSCRQRRFNSLLDTIRR